MIPKLEERISSKCEEILSYLENFEREGVMLDIGDLLETVSQQVGTLEELKKETLELECSLERTMNEYIRVCERLTKTLSFVIEEYKLGQQFKYDNVAMQWIQHRYNTMILKLKCVHISFFSFPILLSKKKGF